MDLNAFLAHYEEIERDGKWSRILRRIEAESYDIRHSNREGLKYENARLNRYRDVLPWDHSRVVLSDGGYINASHVVVPGVEKRYILTQGPLWATQGDFWQMVWEQNCSGIIMLNRFVESNRVKCHVYVPLGSGDGKRANEMTLSNFDIKLVKSIVEDHFDIRELMVTNKKTNEQRQVKHFNFKSWPDFGVPQSTDSFLQFFVKLHTMDVMGVDRRLVIHCSAGIGRSGTFAIADACLATFRKYKDLRRLNIPKMVIELRKGRMGLIQTPDQLRFCYKIIVDALTKKEWRDALDIPEVTGALVTEVKARVCNGVQEENEKEEGHSSDGSEGRNPSKRIRCSKEQEDNDEADGSVNNAFGLADRYTDRVRRRQLRTAKMKARVEMIKKKMDAKKKLSWTMCAIYCSLLASLCTFAVYLIVMRL